MGRERDRDEEKHQCVVASHMVPTGDLAPNPGMCPDWELNWRPFGLQVGTQSTEIYISINRFLHVFKTRDIY